jgi:hypothetical protein
LDVDASWAVVVAVLQTIVVVALGLLLELRRHQVVVVALVVPLRWLLLPVIVLRRLLTVVSLRRVLGRILMGVLLSVFEVMVDNLLAWVVVSEGTLLAVIVVFTVVAFKSGRLCLSVLFVAFLVALLAARLVVLVDGSEGGGGRRVLLLVAVHRLLQSISVRGVLLFARRHLLLRLVVVDVLAAVFIRA